MNPCPKPVKREKKKPSGLRRSPMGPKTWEEAIERKRARGRRAKRKTKHGRREREWGRMAFARYGGCDVVLAHAEEFGVDPIVDAPWAIGPCRGPIQFMHLHLGKTAGRRRAPDRHGAGGCKGHHDDIDGTIGGKARWYVVLGFDNQQRLKRRLVDRQCARWDALTDADREFWDQQAAAARAGRGE